MQTPAPEQPGHRVVEVAITGLFNRFNHSVPLRSDDRVTILHGPNGVGKTVLMQFVAACLRGRLYDLGTRPFSVLAVTFDDGSVLRAEPHRESKAELLHLSYKKGTQSWKQDVPLVPADVTEWARAFERESPFIGRAADFFIDRRTGEQLTSLELFRRYGSDQITRRTKHPDWYQELLRNTPVHFIDTQRLMTRSMRRTIRGGDMYFEEEGSAYVPTVGEYARDLKSQIIDSLARYGSESQRLDQTFPQRLLDLNAANQLPILALKDRMSRIDSQTQRLQSIGLLDKTTTHAFDTRRVSDLDNTKTSVLSLYVEDTQIKLSVLQTLAERIELLLENVNAKLLNKALRIDRDRGFVAIGDASEQLSPDALSSGEQHEIVLLYDLLFKIRPNTLVLIDEPELSLHVTWQKRFLPDLLKIVKTAGIDALIATHSPFIIGDRHDLAIGLAAEDSN